jgi:hypothetical protein
MKKIFATITVLSVIAFSSFAQQEELKSATANIEKQDYIAALEDLSKAKKKVNELMTAQIAAVLPSKFGEFKMADDNGMGMMGESQGVTINKLYKKPVEKKENAEGGEGEEMMEMGMYTDNAEQVMVEITTNMMSASDVMSAHSLAEEGMNMGMEGMKTEAYRVKGYRALSKTYGGESAGESEDGAGMNMGQPKIDEAQVIVGGAFIRVTAQGLKEDGQAKAFVEMIDFEKLIGIVGK